MVSTKQPTFNADDVFANLLLNEHIRDGLDQVIDGVNAGMNRLETLYSLPNRQGVTQKRVDAPAGPAQAPRVTPASVHLRRLIIQDRGMLSVIWQ